MKAEGVTIAESSFSLQNGVNKDKDWNYGNTETWRSQNSDSEDGVLSGCCWCFSGLGDFQVLENWEPDLLECLGEEMKLREGNSLACYHTPFSPVPCGKGFSEWASRKGEWQNDGVGRTFPLGEHLTEKMQCSVKLGRVMKCYLDPCAQVLAQTD